MSWITRSDPESGMVRAYVTNAYPGVVIERCPSGWALVDRRLPRERRRGPYLVWSDAADRIEMFARHA